MKRLVPVTALILLAGTLAAMLRLWSPAPEQAPGPATEPPRGGDFVLESASGPLGLADLRGRLVLIYFGYTWCPDICPTSLALIGQALDGLGAEELDRVQVLFVSVDPGRDSPERLEEYVAYFHPRILGLTGSPEAIDRVARQYGAAYRISSPDSSGGYLVDHSAYTYLVEPQGRLVETLDHASTPARILEAIRRWLPAGGRM